MSFEKELENLINQHSKENESNTPDFILAQYISGCLSAFTTATQQRETWYGRDARPSHNHALELAGQKSGVLKHHIIYSIFSRLKRKWVEVARYSA